VDKNVAEDFRAKLKTALAPVVKSGADVDALATSLFEIMQQIAAAEVDEYAQRASTGAKSK
jgi:hypothetical protein